MSKRNPWKYEELRDRIINDYGLYCEVLTPGVLRVSDGVKALDIYRRKYFMVDTGERGYRDWRTDDKLIQMYFGLNFKHLD